MVTYRGQLLYRQGLYKYRHAIFRVVAEPQNSGKSTKFTKTRKIPRNSVEISLLKYMSVQQFRNLSQLLGVFTCRELANLCQNFVTEMCKQRSETTRHRLCCEKLGTCHDVKRLCHWFIFGA